MGQREVELDSDLVRDPGMVGELLAAVELDGSERLAFEGPRHLVPDALGGLTAALPADEEAVFAVDERQQAGASGFAGNRVALPMPGLAALVGGRRPLRNLVRHLDFATPLRRAAAALAAMAQPSLRLAPADAAVEETTAYAAVDGRVADGASAQLEREPALYLLRRPLLFQELVPDQREHVLVVEHASPAARLPPLGVAPLRGRGAVEPLARVALELARHRRLAAPDSAGYLADAPPVASHQHDALALMQRKMDLVAHGSLFRMMF